MGVRLAAGVACVAVALVGLTLATPQEAQFGVHVDVKDLLDARGFNRGSLKDGDIDEKDLGKLLDRIDGLDLDPDLARNLDPAALAGLLAGLTPEELAALGLSSAEAQDLIDRLNDPDLTEEELADIAAELSERGLRFVNDDADGRFDAGEAAYVDLDGDGKVSENDVKLGVLALLLGIDRGLSDTARQQFTAYELAGGLGLSRPASAASKSTATAATARLAAAGYPTDRAMGPASVLCVQLYSPALTCHTRTFVHGDIVRQGDHYLFTLAADAPVAVPLEPSAPGPRSTAHLQAVLQGATWIALPGLTPADVLVGTSRPDLEVGRDGNGMLWLRGATGLQHVNLTWVVDLGYYDLPVAADVGAADVPLAMQPRLDAVALAVGQHIADAAGARDRGYGDAIRALATHLRGFGLGALPDRDEQSDDLLAVAEAQVGCARHRAEAFTLAAQAMGMPARFVLNEAHAFAEVYVPKAGWHLVDLGTCGQVQVRSQAGHREIMALQDLPYVRDDAPASQADLDAPPQTAVLDIVDWPASLRPNTDFTIGGKATSSANIPAGIPITFTYNQTKEQPGTPFCSTQTQAGGDFQATCRLPAGMPPAPNGGWQLVARMAPSVLDGAPSLPAYSDPPFVVQKTTTLELLGHARTSAGVPVAYTALVRDEDGAPVVQQPIRLTVDGEAAQTRATDSTGRARFTLNLDAGQHTLTAAWLGDDSYDPSEDTFALEATSVRIVARVDQARLDQGTLALDGALTVDNSPGTGRSLSLRWRNDPDGPEQSKTLAAGSNGLFQAAFNGLPRPGPGLVTLMDSKSGVGVDVAYARSVDATAIITAPARWATGTPAPVQVTVQGPPDPVPVRLLLDGLAVADLEVGQHLPAQALVTVPSGVHTLTVEAGPGVRLAAAPVSILSSPVQATVTPPTLQAPGSTLVLEGQVFFDGQGLAGPVTVRLRGLLANGTSASDGRFTLALAIPAGTSPGNATAVIGLPDVGHHIDVAVRILRPANLHIDAPKLSFNAFSATAITVRGEGDVRVRIDGEAAGNGGRIDVPTSTWLYRRITIDARATPTDPDVSPSRSTVQLTVLNPVTAAGAPLLALGLVVASWQGTRWVQRRRAHRNRFLPLPPRSPIRVVSPALPPRVPRAFDPALDRHLTLRLPRGGPWSLTDARGRPVRATWDGREVRIDLTTLPRGPQTLYFAAGRRRLSLAIAVQDLRTALDEATLQLLTRVGSTTPWPAPLQAMQDGLRKAGASDPHATAVRREAEASLYAVEDIGRERFHAFFLALDAAQAGSPA